MSKDGSLNGATNIGLQELLRINPDLMGDLQRGGGPSLTEQAMAAPPALPVDFYGSGTEIVQPDRAYYEQFPLPGSEPAPQASASSASPVVNTPSYSIPIFDIGIGSESGRSVPAALAEAIEVRNRQSVSSRKRKAAQDTIDAYQPPRQSMPILDMAENNFQPAVMPVTEPFIPEPMPQAMPAIAEPAPSIPQPVPQMAPFIPQPVPQTLPFVAEPLPERRPVMQVVRPDFRNFDIGMIGL